MQSSTRRAGYARRRPTASAAASLLAILAMVLSDCAAPSSLLAGTSPVYRKRKAVQIDGSRMGGDAARQHSGRATTCDMFPKLEGMGHLVSLHVYCKSFPKGCLVASAARLHSHLLGKESESLAF